MNVQVVVGREAIQQALKTLRTSSEPGKSCDGARLLIHYRAFGTPKAKALQEAAVAREEGFAMDVFSGRLDRVFLNKAGELCFSIRCLERQSSDGRHCFRTFNTVKGNVTELVILGNGNGHSRDTKESDAPEGK